MKKILITLAVASSCGLAFAQSAQTGIGGYTREEVLAELSLLRATGELEERQVTEIYAVEVRDVDKEDVDEAKTRAEVKQELIDARHSDRHAAWSGNDGHAWSAWVPQG